MNRTRDLRSAVSLSTAIAGGALMLQWWWAGWSPYTGEGPSLGTRWLLTSSVGAALLLPPWAAVAGASAMRGLIDSGLLDQLRITRWDADRLTLLVMARTLSPVLLALLVSVLVWVPFASRTPLLDIMKVEGGLSAPAIALGYGVAAIICVAFGLWGAALAAGRFSPESGRWGDWRRLGSWGPVMQLFVTLGPWLVGPLLPHLARPERALDATLIVNPVTAVGAALGMDLLRSPRLYDLTRAPEYWYTYPPAWAVAALYGALAVWGAYRLRRGLEVE